MPIYNETYIKAKVRELDGVIKTNFLGRKVPNENMHYTCIAVNYQQVYLEECKYRIKKIQISRFINAELKSDSESESESGTELMSKLESNSDTE